MVLAGSTVGTPCQPAHQENRKDDAAVPADLFGRDLGAWSAGLRQLMQGRMEHDRIDRHVHDIEHPAEPGDEQRQPLVCGHALCPGPAAVSRLRIESPPSYGEEFALSR